MITKGNVKMLALFLKYSFSLLLEELTEVAKLSGLPTRNKIQSFL